MKISTENNAYVLRRKPPGKLLPKAHVATVYAKPLGRPIVDTFVTEVSQDTWIYFPWDMEMKPAPTISERTKK